MRDDDLLGVLALSKHHFFDLKTNYNIKKSLISLIHFTFSGSIHIHLGIFENLEE
jgi:hypothetical protein